MYEHLRNELLSVLGKRFDADDLVYIGVALDQIAEGYTISPAERGLTVLGREEAENLVKMYITVKAMEGLAKTTLESYFLSLQIFVRWLRCPIQQVTTNDIRLYLFEYKANRGITNRSLDSIRGCLASFFRWAHGEEYLPRDPMYSIKPIKYTKKPRQPLEQVDLEYLRRACRTSRELAILETLYSTGCRVSELGAIKLSDVDWNKHTVQLFGKGSKYRTSYLNAKAEVAIRAYLHERKHDSIYLFCNDRGGGKMGKDNIAKIMRGISSRREYGHDKKVTPHIVRHTTATVALRNGMPVENVQKLLGHSSIATTMTYAKTLDSDVARDHERRVI